MAYLSAESLTNSSFTYHPATSGAGDTFPSMPGVFLHVKNGSGSSVTVTFPAQVYCDHGFLHNWTETVPANGERFLATFPARVVDADQIIHITYSSVTNVTVAVLTPPF